MNLTQSVIDRILVTQFLMEEIRFSPTTSPDRATLAKHVLTSHDASELCLAAIADFLEKPPSANSAFLMNYFPKIKETHPEDEVPGREYFRMLNRVRNSLKHEGVFPDPGQWHRVGERVYGYIKQWCTKYLDLAIDQLDESALIETLEIRQEFSRARSLFSSQAYKEVLESVALALNRLFRSNVALRGLIVGDSSAKTAVKLAGFGVHANDFIALQEFLPSVNTIGDQPTISWAREKYGHPGNWTEHSAYFCWQTAVRIAIQIQHASWIPSAIGFMWIYEHRVTAIENNVEINYRPPMPLHERMDPVVVKTLQRGESLRCTVEKKGRPFNEAFGGEPYGRILSVTWSNNGRFLGGEVEASKVQVICVPKQKEAIQEQFPDLPDLPYN
jgi:hypothetical protein